MTLAQHRRLTQWAAQQPSSAWRAIPRDPAALHSVISSDLPPMGHEVLLRYPSRVCTGTLSIDHQRNTWLGIGIDDEWANAWMPIPD